MTTLPDLGILAVPGAPSAFLSLVRAMDEWCRPRAADPATESPAAWLASSPACPGLTTVSAGARPVAVWVDHREALEQAVVLTPGLRVLVTARPEVAAGGGQSVLFPEDGLDLRHHLPLAPVVRRRWRSQLGLPSTMIVSAGGESPAMLPYDLLPTAMALASVVVARGPRLAEAMAWAAPCVTDPGSAAALGAVEGEVVVGPSTALDLLAAGVAADDGLAATLSGAGRRFVERRVDRHRPARRVAEALGLLDWGRHAATRAAGRAMDDLHTPAISPLRSRVEALLVAPSAR